MDRSVQLLVFIDSSGTSINVHTQIVVAPINIDDHRLQKQQNRRNNAVTNMNRIAMSNALQTFMGKTFGDWGTTFIELLTTYKNKQSLGARSFNVGMCNRWRYLRRSNLRIHEAVEK